MRPLEGALILILAVAAFLQITVFARRFRMPLALLGVVAVVLHLLWERGHFQMLPVYVALVIVVVLQVVPQLVRASTRIKSIAAQTVLLLCATSLMLSFVFPMFSLPKPTGSYPVGTRTLYLTDKSRREDAVSDPRAKRELVVQVWYPAESTNNHLAPYRQWAETKLYDSYESVLWTNSRVDAPVASQGGPFPLLLFNHGWNGRRTQDTFLTEDLASHGYVVASIDHPYNAARVAFPDGHVVDGVRGSIIFNPGGSTAAQVRDVWDRELDKWTADEVFVLNTLQAMSLDQQGPWYGHVNTELAGAFGHSFGGSASLQVCGEDRRIRSAINLDGWTFEGIRYRTTNKQVMFVYEEASQPEPEDVHSVDPDVRVGAELDVSDMAGVDESLEQYGGYRLFVRGTTHMDFTDRPLVSPLRRLSLGGSIPPARMESIVRAYVLAFFEKTLHGRDSALLDSGNSSPFQEVQFEERTPKAKTAFLKPDGALSGH